jgi:hypothetical protein
VRGEILSKRLIFLSGLTPQIATCMYACGYKNPEKNNEASSRESRGNRDIRALEQRQDDPRAVTAACQVRGEILSKRLIFLSGLTPQIATCMYACGYKSGI